MNESVDPFNLMMRKAVTACGRRLGFQRDLAKKKKGDYLDTPQDVDSLDKANLVGSRLPNGMHAPCIDLDFPAYLIESSTPGHYHLYLEKEVEWNAYVDVLKALARAGLIEKGYATASIDRRSSWLRLPGERKAA